jgi:tetratricopeptide (TPR) repeat protein
MLATALLATHLLFHSRQSQNASAAPSSVSSVSAIAAADKAYSDHEWSRAESLYKQLTDEDPDNARYWYRLGVSARVGRHYALALQAFQQAKARGSGKGLSPSLANYELASTYAATGDTPHALEALKASADAGFSEPTRLENDVEWTSMRSDTRFTSLLNLVHKNAAPCDQPEFHQFDFWLGDWDVFSASGGPRQGTSHIAAEMGGCVVWENWTSASSSYFGKSYNTYNNNLHRWEQYWVDNAAGVIFFHGNLNNGVMDYWTDDIVQPDGHKLQRHLQFIPMAAGKIRQFSQASLDGGKTWNTEYDFLYTRHIPSAADTSAP